MPKAIALRCESDRDPGQDNPQETAKQEETFATLKRVTNALGAFLDAKYP